MALLLIAGHLAASPLVFRNTAPGVRYVGSAACVPCHKTIYDRYVRTPMGRSVTRPGVGLVLTPVRVFNAKFNRKYELQRQGADLILTESQKKDGKTVFATAHRLEFAIGSGVNGISFAVRRGDHLFQAPLSYYTAADRWDLSPGFEENGEGFNRPIHEACIVCHAGRAQAVPGRDGLYVDPPFAELAIGCENCHGPGQLHVSERTTGRAQVPDTSIVNPRRLPARLAEDICMLCHQGGNARVLLPGKDYADFRPGTPLFKTLAIIGLPGEEAGADLLEHHASMKSSACFQKTNGRLGCMTCHNPHEQPSPSEAPAYFRERCFTCHNEHSCKLDIVARRKTSPPDNCIGCHMPKRADNRISHSALTNHRIPANPGVQTAGQGGAARIESPDLPGLAVLDDEPGGRVRLPLVTRLAAYGELLTRAPGLKSKYFGLLEEAARTDADDPLVLAALGHRALGESSLDAAALLLKAEKKGASSAITYLDLSEALGLAGQLNESVSALERGARLFPFSQAIRKHLVLGYIRQKQYEKARRALEEYVQDFPEDDFMRGLLAQAVDGVKR